MSPQTENTLRALQRDGYLCQYCLWSGVVRETHEGHHIMGRGRSDSVEDIISLCPECHRKAEAKYIKKEELYEILTGMGHSNQ